MASNFDKLAAKLSQKPGVTNPRGLAATIGRKAYSPQIMAKASAQGKPAATVQRQQRGY